MIRLLTSLLFAATSAIVAATPNSSDVRVASDTIYSLSDVDTEPSLKGGMPTLYEKWSRIVRYPAEARRYGIQGKVFLSFVVDENGDMTDVKVEKGIGYGCDEAATDSLLKTGLKWKPATKDGKNVKVRIFMPFSFKLG